MECASGGCTRCSTLPHLPCCDLCNPQAFDDLFFYMEPPPAPTTKPSKSSLQKYKKGEREERLSQALNAWRQRVTIEKYGEAIFRDVGSSLVLPNELLERLVDCSHYGKITNMEQLGKEVDWMLMEEHGPEVVRLIMDICPPQPRKRVRRRKKVSAGEPTARQPLGTNVRVINAQPGAPVVAVSVLSYCSRQVFLIYFLLIAAFCVFILQQSPPPAIYIPKSGSPGADCRIIFW